MEDNNHKVIDSSGNVFADLNLPTSKEDMLKVAIAAAITTTIQKRKLTQTQAAKIVNADQAKISALLRGRLNNFSVERLIKYLIHLGMDLDIKISRKRKSNEPGQVRIKECA